jgi:hypothetical protein
MSQWFVINDIEDFTQKTRLIVYNNFGSWSDKKTVIDIMIDEVPQDNKEDFDKVLSQKESLVIVKQIVKKQKNKKNNDIRYILNEKLFIDIVENLNSRMVSNIMNGLVQKGYVESAFDSQKNDFIFWVKDYEGLEKEKPETD